MKIKRRNDHKFDSYFRVRKKKQFLDVLIYPDF